jgi:hypothetical protein
MTGYEFVKTADGRYHVRAPARERKVRVTRKELRQYVSAILHSGIVGQVDKKHEAFFRLLLQRHPAVTEKIGCGVDHFEIRPNQFRSPAFWIVRVDGTETDFSFNVCINGKGHSRRAVVHNAFRSAVVDQISEFKLSILRAGGARCALTGEPLDGSCHADHVIPFKALADTFIASVGGLDAIPIVPSADGVMVHHVADGEVKERWRAFHKERAVLVTVEANLRRRRGDA